MQKELLELKRFTKNCREDMHEPDEHPGNITAHVEGHHLDNAMGNMPGTGELVVVLTDDTENKEAELRINLATLIALARKAKL